MALLWYDVREDKGIVYLVRTPVDCSFAIQSGQVFSPGRRTEFHSFVVIWENPKIGLAGIQRDELFLVKSIVDERVKRGGAIVTLPP